MTSKKIWGYGSQIKPDSRQLLHRVDRLIAHFTLARSVRILYKIYGLPN